MASRKGRQRRNRQDAPRRKISEMILELARDYIVGPSDPRQRQSHLNAVCSAWNISCKPPDLRQGMLDQYMAEYQRTNPHVDLANCAMIRTNMEDLIRKKLEMFPGDLKQIANARLMPAGDSVRVEVVSVTIRQEGADS